MASAVVVTMAWGSRTAKGYQPLMSRQDFLFPLDLNLDLDGVYQGEVLLLHCSPSQTALRTTPVLSSSFGLLTHFSVQIPREEVCFSAANQPNQRRCRQAPLSQLQPTVFIALPFTRAVFSLLQRL